MSRRIFWLCLSCYATLAWTVHLVKGSSDNSRGPYIRHNDSTSSTRLAESILGYPSSSEPAVSSFSDHTAISSFDIDNGAFSSKHSLVHQTHADIVSNIIHSELDPTILPHQPISASVTASVPFVADIHATKTGTSGADEVSSSGTLHTSVYFTYPPARTANARTGESLRYPLPTSLNGVRVGNINVPKLNFTKIHPKPTGIGFPLPSNNQIHQGSRCSGTQTIAPWLETLTITTTEVEGTITIAPGDPIPSGTLINPLPPCKIYDPCLTVQCGLPFASINLGAFQTANSAQIVLVTKKVPVISYSGQAVDPIFGASATRHQPEVDLHRSLPTAVTTNPIQGSSGAQFHGPFVVSPEGGVGPLPDSGPGSISTTVSSHGGSTPQNDNGESGSSVHSGEESSPGAHGSNGAVHGSDDEGSGTHDENAGSVNGNSQNPSDHHDNENPPAIIWNEGTTNLNNIPIKNSPKGVVIGSHTIAPGAGPTTVNINGQVFTIEPSRVINGGTTLPLPALHHQPVTSLKVGNSPIIIHPDDIVIASRTYDIGSSSTAIVHNGQTYLVGPSKVVVGHTTAKVPHTSPGPAVVTAGGEKFSVFPGQLEAHALTVLIPSSPQPSKFIYHGQSFSINPSQLIAPDTTFSLNPTITPAPMVTTVNGIEISLGPSAAVIGSRTHTFKSGRAPSIVVYNGQTISFGSNGIGLAGTTIAAAAQPTYSVYRKDGIVVSIAASMAVIAGHTYSLDPEMTPFTTIVYGQPVTISLDGVFIPGATFPVPMPTPSFSTASRGSLTFSVNPSEAVIQGHTYHLSPGATPTTTMISGQKVVIGPDGVAFPGTTVYLPLSTRVSQITVINGLTFSLGPSKVAIGGTTYALGNGAKPTTVTIGGERISIGPAGVGLSDTTIAPGATRTGFSSKATDHLSTSGFSLSPATPSAFSQSNLESGEVVSATTAVQLRIGGLILMTLGFSTLVACV